MKINLKNLSVIIYTILIFFCLWFIAYPKIKYNKALENEEYLKAWEADEAEFDRLNKERE